MTKRNLPQGSAVSLFAALLSRPYVLLVCAQLFWAANIAAGRLAIGVVDPFALSALRWTLALLLIAPFAIVSVRREWAAIKAGWFWFVLYGALGYASFNILIYVGTTHTTAVNAAMEQAAIPMLVVLGNFLVFGVRATLLHVIGIALTIYGVVHVATHGNPGLLLGLDLNVGDAMVLGACLLYAIYSLLLRFRPDVSWMSFLFCTTAVAAVIALFYQTLFGGGPSALADTLTGTSGFGWLLIAYVAVFPSVIAQLFYARGVELIGPNRASLFINLLPVFGAVLGVVLVGETLAGFHIVAALFIVTGIALAEYAARRRTARSAKPPV